MEYFVKKNYKMLFESEFCSWYTDEKLWPSTLSEDMFYEWFDIECFSVIEDLVDTERIVPEINDQKIREIIFQNYRIIYKIKYSEIVIATKFHSARNLKEITRFHQFVLA